MKNNLILIGYMGCGKSSVGKALAKAWEQEFVDTDAWIEAKEGCTVSEIFAARGEGYFRDLETACVHTLMKNVDNSVISVGGGLPVREENGSLLSKLGRVIYLKASPETIYERLKMDKTRPLLQTPDPYSQICKMLAEREGRYRAVAHHILTVDGKTIAELVEEIKATAEPVEERG